MTHAEVDRHHLTMCGKCTCTDPDLAFCEQEDAPTCAKCLRLKEAVHEAFVSGRRGRRVGERLRRLFEKHYEKGLPPKW